MILEEVHLVADLAGIPLDVIGMYTCRKPLFAQLIEELLLKSREVVVLPEKYCFYKHVCIQLIELTS